MTDLQRKRIQPLFAAAEDFHAGMMLQRGWTTYDEEGGAKANHLQRICNTVTSDFYQRAYARWEKATADKNRFIQHELKLVNRLLIGLAGTGSLETGCAISHSSGMPYIPGSSVKGVVRAYAQETLGNDHPLVREMFGNANDKSDEDSLSGVVAFHDAWWVPPLNGQSSQHGQPFVPEVITVHHHEYYAQQGAQPASDKDSPVPVAILATSGKFLFVIEGPRAWATLAGKWLVSALSENGIGAKTRAGYGYFEAPAAVMRLATETWENGKLVFNPGKQEIYGAAGNVTTAPIQGKQNVDAFCAALGDDLATRWRKKKLDGVKGLRLEVEIEGNRRRLVRVLT